MNGMPDLAKQILDAKTPWEAKSLSKYIHTSASWDAENTEVMVDAVTCKFNQVPEAMDALQATGDKTLVEAVPGQFYWGSGLSATATLNTSADAWPGKNHLGKILMSVCNYRRGSGPW